MDLVNYRPLTPLSFLERSARVFPDRLAVVDGESRLTYQEFLSTVKALGGGLKALGLLPGDRIAFLAPNQTPLLAAHFAVPRIGGVLVALNTRLARPEIAHILRHSGAKALVVSPELLPRALELKAECPDLQAVVSLGVDTGEQQGDMTYQELLGRGAAEPAELLVTDEQALIALNYTSGTTGYPKGVMYTHRGAYLNAIGNAVEMELGPATRYLWTLPMFHCNGWCFPWAITAIGGVHVCLPRVVPSDVFKLIVAEEITHLSAAPTVLIDLASYAATSKVKLAQPLQVMTGGAAPAPQVISNMEAIGANVVHLYGLTETYGPSTFCQWRPEWSQLPFSEQAAVKALQGVADQMVEQRVVRADMTDVAPDGQELGELVFRGNVVMQGYYKDPEATEKAFEGGWFHSGDMAVMHQNGYVEIRDRNKDVIISGGENVSSLEVERTIFAHPAVQEVAVVATPHERWGEVPKAFVVLRSGCTLTAEELLSFCHQHLARFKCPKGIHFVDALPKTSTGKIQKYVLREQERNPESRGVAGGGI